MEISTNKCQVGFVKMKNSNIIILSSVKDQGNIDTGTKYTHQIASICAHQTSSTILTILLTSHPRTPTPPRSANEIAVLSPLSGEVQSTLEIAGKSVTIWLVCCS